MRLGIYQLKSGKKVISLLAETEEERDTIQLCMPATMVYHNDGTLRYTHTNAGPYHTLGHRHGAWTLMCKLSKGRELAPHMRLSPVEYRVEGEDLVIKLPEKPESVRGHEPADGKTWTREPEEIRLDQAVKAINHYLSLDASLDPVIEDRHLTIYKTTRRRVV